MFARVVTILVLLAIAVVTTAASAHAARMSVAPGHTAHAAMMMQDADGTAPACAHHQPCGSADVGLCGFFCAGLPLLPTLPAIDAGPAFTPANQGIPAAGIHASRVPGLTERPPKLRLL
mgnify:CR=1 FL=1